METTRYIFQSPYYNQIQIGKPEVTGSKEKGSGDSQIIQSTNKVASDAAVFKASQIKEVTPSVDGNLDIYA
ncbi:MAG: hypothetical protein AABY36_09245 [Campylobacterota bacterium]